MRRTWTSKWVAGNDAPAFKAVTHEGIALSKANLLGKKYILFFYNHDGSETCTREACNMRDNYQMLTDLGYALFGVSEDSATKHRKFISKFNLPYPLIVDENNSLAKTFDIYGPKDFMGRTTDAVHRTTFVINEKGRIEAVIHPIDSSNHAMQIVETLKTKV